jgi:hypothetical protein
MALMMANNAARRQTLAQYWEQADKPEQAEC